MLRYFGNPPREQGEIDVDPAPRLRVGLLFPEKKRASATSKRASQARVALPAMAAVMIKAAHQENASPRNWQESTSLRNPVAAPLRLFDGSLRS